MRKIFVLFALLLFSATAAAQEDGNMVAIQAKKYNLKHEVVAGPGFLPLSAYYKGLTVGGSYTYHFSDFYAIRAINFQYVRNMSTGLRKSLENNFGVTPSAFAKIRYYANIDFMVTPLYRKMILFNKWVLHGETFFLAGAGGFKFEGQPNTPGSSPENGKFRPAFDIGAGFRIWINEWLSTRLDVTDYLYLASGTNFNNVLYLGLNLAINFPIHSRSQE